jgi:putative membrane protein insertion efficiency factor
VTIAASVLVSGIEAYRMIVRPLTGSHCRHVPSCSTYGIEALNTHGAWRGTRLTVGRVLRCHPWSACGFDPVPPRK